MLTDQQACKLELFTRPVIVDGIASKLERQDKWQTAASRLRDVRHGLHDGADVEDVIAAAEQLRTDLRESITMDLKHAPKALRDAVELLTGILDVLQ